MSFKEFVKAQGAERLAEEKRFWDKLAEFSHLQAAWLLLLYCASPRFNYAARTLPPELAKYYAEGHDKGTWATLCKLLGREDLANDLRSTQA